MDARALLLSTLIAFLPMQKAGTTISNQSTLEYFDSRYDSAKRLYLYSGGD